MPRVYTKTARASKKSRSCTGCRKEVEPGQRFYTWSRRFGRSGATYYRHVECGRPRPTELSSRKTAQVEEAILDAEKTIDGWTPTIPDDIDFDSDYLAEHGGTFEVEIDDVKGAMEDVANSAAEVGQEYADNADAMPEALQYGSQAEAMRDVASELEDWASTVRDWEPDETEITIEPGQTRDDVEQALDQLADNIKTSATEAFGDLPEYQG